MDKFSNLQWASSTDASRASSKPGSQGGSRPESRADSFSGLAASFDLTAKPKKLDAMTLDERKKYLAKQSSAGNTAGPASSGSGADGPGAWSGLDLLSGGIGDSERAFGGTSGVPEIPVVPSSSSSNSQDNIDDLFEVFNRPKPADEPVQSSTSSPSLTATPPEPRLSSQQSLRAPAVDSQHGSQRSSRNSSRPGSRPGGSSFGSPDLSDSESFTEGTIRVGTPQEKRSDAGDAAIAELVDMGFSVKQSRHALARTRTGVDVREAIDIIMDEAHKRNHPEAASEPRRPARQSQNANEDIGKLAQDLSSQFISKAGSFFNQGRKNLAKAIEQYNSSGSPSPDGTPAWMRDAPKYEKRAARAEPEPAVPSRNASPLVTNEAMSLELDREEVLARRPAPRSREPKPDGPAHRRESREPPQPKWVDPARTAVVPPTSRTNIPAPPPSRAELMRQRQKSLLEEGMYVSPHRRAATPKAEDAPRKAPASGPPAPRPAAPVKPKAPTREAVPISSTALTMASSAREQGNEAFKRGDFSQAAVYYSQSLESVPPKHLLRTVILSNRAACNIKCGDAKSAINDANEALDIIGPGLGANEEAEPGKPLKTIWSKVVTRKAEGSEHLEKFQDALDAWNLLLNNGFSSDLALAGKRRCQDALSPKPKPKPKPAAPKAPASSGTAASGPQSAAGRAALQRIQEAHATDAKSETERFALHDSVSSRIDAWRNGKEDNLRALLSSLDAILWPESGWKKVSLAELVLPKKVKIVYMKAVARTHPDKISASATVEQKMIAETVFITLNQSWDQFKAANNLA